ncbi:M10 family metallopeptidase C-terminal domain-containing protein [Tropicimonas sediminicola]|uniref:Hemolysin-type calcium-binding repeat-containing protein n=1 Tax=Tropicimonas sediminicola TaxID=1031541 RepID=A0A239JJR5_9RHOB|nr:hypothetical protein [Tropicimonas sediminicola]SNT06039.1 Hemolysin-type calcium-binding repeat-containing protein [Tropicimonas sediminicola]
MTKVGDYRAILAYLDNEGDRWNATAPLGTSVFISYRFATSSDLPGLLEDENPYGAKSFRSYTSAEEAAFRKALGLYEAVAGVRFVETTDESAMVLAYAADIDAGNLAGYASLPFTNIDSGAFDNPKDFVMNLDKNEMNSGHGFTTVLHELGHTLGLSHPFEGAFTLKSSLDSTDTTVMSYNHTIDPQTEPSPFDVQAVQHIYGKSGALKGWSYGLDKGVFTAEGTKRAEEVVGLLHMKNHIDGKGGADKIWGWEKADRLEGGGGNDRLMGNGGADILRGGAGDDTLLGDRDIEGRLYDFGDKLYGQDGDDTLKGHDGNDLLVGGKGDDLLVGDDGEYWWVNDDILRGGAGKDDLRGGGGDDTLDGGTGVDVLRGGAGDDTLSGGGQKDRLLGEAGNDSLSGDAGNDRLIGGGGTDTLAGGSGADVLIGGRNARDTFVFTRKDFGATDRITDYDLGIDRIDIAATGFSASDARFVKTGGGSDSLVRFDADLEIRIMDVTKAELTGLADWQIFIEA